MTFTTLRRAALLRHSALGLAVAVTSVGAATLAPQAAIAQKAPKLSKGFQGEIVKVQAAVQAAEADPTYATADAAAKAALLATARAALPAAKAVIAADNSQDKLYYGQFAYNIGAQTGDTALQREGLDYMIQAGSDDPAQLVRLQTAAGQLAYNANDWAAAQRYLSAASAADPGDPRIGALLAETYFAQSQFDNGFEILNQAISVAEAAGVAADENWYKRALSVAFKNELGGPAIDWAKRYATAYPSENSWGDAIAITRQFATLDGQAALDILRLTDRTGAWRTKNDVLEYVELADPRRLPGEVVRIVDQGMALGLITSADSYAVDVRGEAQGRVASDKASLPGLQREAMGAGSSATTAMAAGDAFLSYGDAAVAEAIYRAALDKSGVDTARVMTRLGIALVDQGKFAEAQEVFGQVTGARKPVADLWAIYAGQQAG